MDSSAILSGILIGIFSGVGTSLLSARVTPHFEHRYWKAQRLFEARSATAKELKRLLADYLAGHIAKETVAPEWQPSREFWIAWHAIETDVIETDVNEEFAVTPAAMRVPLQQMKLIPERAG